MSGLTDLDAILASLEVELLPDPVVYVTFADGVPPLLAPLATVVEAEGTTAVLRRKDADLVGLPYDLVMAWITLDVHTSLEGVGLTAAFSRALADAGISCNVLAGHFHDHILVPEADTDEALKVLRQLRS